MKKLIRYRNRVPNIRTFSISRELTFIPDFNKGFLRFHFNILIAAATLVRFLTFFYERLITDGFSFGSSVFIWRILSIGSGVEWEEFQVNLKHPESCVC